MAVKAIISAAQIAYSDQSDKIQQIYHLGNGWEGWAQVEIALGLKRTFEWRKGKGTLDVTHEREKQTYIDSDKRCDFLVTYKDLNNHIIGVSIYELKCMRGNSSLTQFASEVKKDFDKINSGAPLEQWMENADTISGSVVAITVHTGNPGDDSIVAKMNSLAAEKGFEWCRMDTKSPSQNSWPVTEDGRVRMWVWHKSYK